METTEAPSVGLFGRHKSQDAIDSSQFIENDQDGVKNKRNAFFFNLLEHSTTVSILNCTISTTTTTIPLTLGTSGAVTCLPPSLITC